MEMAGDSWKIWSSSVIPFDFARGGPFDYNGLTLSPTRMSNHMPSKVWVEITYPPPNFNGSG